MLKENNKIISPLEKYRNQYALRLHRGISKKVIQHKDARSFYIWLELKPLFIDSIIRNDDGLLPYGKISSFLNISVSGLRGHFVTLKKYKLIKYDKDKNIHFAKYERFAEIFKHTEERKYKLANNGDTEFIVKQVAVFENLAKQDYMKRQKMFYRELFDILFERSRDSKLAQGLTESRLSFLFKNNKECANYFSKSEFKKLRKHFNNYFENYEAKYQTIFKAKMQQLEFGFPDINMQVTLSHTGFSQLFSKEDSKFSCGQYQKKLLYEKKMIFVEGEYQLIKDTSPAIYEKILGGRADIFSYEYVYRKQCKTVRKYFRNCPDTVRPVFPERFIKDNFRWREAKSRVCYITERKDELFTI